VAKTKAKNHPAGAGGKVRISMSAEVANDLEAFKKGVVKFAEQLGCPECFSGLDCTFESEREFTIGPDGAVTAAVAPKSALSVGAGTRTATVALAPGDEFKLDVILKRIDILGRRLGSHWEQGGQAWCCSGFDVTFGREVRLVEDGSGNFDNRPL
jgi:hypothetical protein